MIYCYFPGKYCYFPGKMKLTIEIPVLHILVFVFFFFFFYCCSSTVVSISPHLIPSTPLLPASHSQYYPIWLCPCVLYTCSLTSLHLFSPTSPLFHPLCLLSVCSLFQCLWLYFACLFVLFIRFHLQVRSYGICLSLPGLLHLA